MVSTLVSDAEAVALAQLYWREAQGLGESERLDKLAIAQRFAYLARGWSTDEIMAAVPHRADCAEPPIA